jgi:2'-5' RNA ligase
MIGAGSIVRCFIAIELPPDVFRVLQDLQTCLGKGRERGAKWVAPGGIHLTLKFLGDVPAERIAPIGSAMERVAAAGTPLALHLAGAGCFPSAERPRVLWVGMAGDTERLAKLQARMQAAMAELGFPREARLFTPHLTLARMRDLASAEDLARLGPAVRALSVPRVGFTAGEVALIRSDLLLSGAVYTILATSRLGGVLDGRGGSGSAAPAGPDAGAHPGAPHERPGLPHE